MKKLLGLLLALGLALAMFACAANNNDNDPGDDRYPGSAAFDMAVLRAAAEVALSPDAAANLLLNGGLLDYEGTLPDDAVLVFANALRDVAFHYTEERSDEIYEGVVLSALFSVEPGVALRVNYAAVRDALDGRLSENAATWLNLMARDTEEGWDGIAQAMLRWEAFERDHHDFVLTLHQNHHYSVGHSQTLLAMYLRGCEDSPVYDEATGMLWPELRESYERFLADENHRMSYYFEIVQQALDIWHANNWQWSGLGQDRDAGSVEGQLNQLLQLESPLVARSTMPAQLPTEPPEPTEPTTLNPDIPIFSPGHVRDPVHGQPGHVCETC